MSTTTNVPQIKLNIMTQAQYDIATKSATELYMITDAGDSGYHPDLFDTKWSDHIINDVQWLRADTFSWQDGTVYAAAYSHLTSDISGKSLSSETIGSTTVQFYLADDGHKICPASQESNVTAIYNATGVAWYYIIDTTNTRFKLPRRHSQQIVRSVKNADSSWYRLYADGWVEQGCNAGQTGTIALPVTMADSNYFISTRVYNGTNNIGWGEYGSDIARTTTTFKVGSLPSIWEVKGMAAIDMSSFQDGEKHLYFYVGSFTQTALENTAGLNASLFNGKADIDLSNAASNASVSAKETIVGWGMPSSSHYDTLTLGASGTRYEAPADGYFFLYAQYNSGSDTAFDMYVVETGLGYRHWYGTSNVWGAGRGFVPVKKGQHMGIDINGSLKNVDFKFVYADGE